MSRRAIVTAAIVALAAVVGVVVWHFSRPTPKTPQSAEFPVMGTLCRVTVYDPAQLQIAYAVAKMEFDRVNAVCSLYDPASELSRLNATAAHDKFLCSPLMWTLLTRAKQGCEESGGEFDVTVKPLMDLWGFYRKRGEGKPTPEEIADALKKVGMDKIVLDPADRSVRFTVPGMSLDLGGIAKGYAADLAAAAMVRVGIRRGVVDIGGNLRFLPEPPPDRKRYRVAIRDPKNADRTLPELLDVRPGLAVSTSGDYERFVVIGGERFGHIISPKTGIPRPVPAATVVAATGLDADVMSTSCCLGGEATAERLRGLHPGTEIIFAK